MMKRRMPWFLFATALIAVGCVEKTERRWWFRLRTRLSLRQVSTGGLGFTMWSTTPSRTSTSTSTMFSCKHVDEALVRCERGEERMQGRCGTHLHVVHRPVPGHEQLVAVLHDALRRNARLRARIAAVVLGLEGASADGLGDVALVPPAGARVQGVAAPRLPALRELRPIQLKLLLVFAGLR